MSRWEKVDNGGIVRLTASIRLDLHPEMYAYFDQLPRGAGARALLNALLFAQEHGYFERQMQASKKARAVRPATARPAVQAKARPVSEVPADEVVDEPRVVVRAQAHVPVAPVAASTKAKEAHSVSHDVEADELVGQTSQAQVDADALATMQRLNRFG